MSGLLLVLLLHHSTASPSPNPSPSPTARHQYPALARRIHRALKIAEPYRPGLRHRGAAFDACCATCGARSMQRCRNHSLGGNSGFDPFAAPLTGHPITPAAWPWFDNDSGIGVSALPTEDATTEPMDHTMSHPMSHPMRHPMSHPMDATTEPMDHLAHASSTNVPAWKRRKLSPKKIMGWKNHTYLFLLSDGHAGSSALAGLLTTSPEVANLCESRVWQCEGEKILTQTKVRWRGPNNTLMSARYLTDAERNQMKKGHQKWRLDKDRKTQQPHIDWLITLNLFHRYWDPSKRVMLDKSPAFLSQGPQIAIELRRAGLKAAFVVMSHSPCTTSTAAHRRELTGHVDTLPNSNLHNWNNTNRMLVDVIEALRDAGENVLHVRYEAMLHDPARFSRELEAFLPALAPLDPTVNGMDGLRFVKQMARQKTADRQLSIAEYSRSHPVLDTCSEYPSDWGPTMRKLGYDSD